VTLRSPIIVNERSLVNLFIEFYISMPSSLSRQSAYHAAGEQKLLAERKKIGNIAQGQVAVTPAFRLPAKYIIHTVGPVWEDGNHGERDILRSCY